MTLLEPEELASFPVAHFSASSIRCYCENPQRFFREYIRYEYEKKLSPALLEGSAFHKILAEMYSMLLVGGKEPSKFPIEPMLEEVFSSEACAKTEWGKTGSVEKSIKNVTNALDFYGRDLPKITKLLSIEERDLSDFEDLSGESMPIPLKGFTDLVTEDGGENLVIRDHKLVSSFTVNAEGEIDRKKLAAYGMQAAPYFFLVRKKYNRNPSYMMFDEVKKTENRDGSPQVQSVQIIYSPTILNRWIEVYKRIVRQLAGQSLIDPETGIMQFIPNPYADFGEEAWADFCEDVDTGRVWTFKAIEEIRKNRYARPEEVEAIF